MSAWNGWYHLMAGTYGSWLPGDVRGFRTRHHREHIEGNYKNPPPPERDAARRRRAETLMKREPIVLSPTSRRAAAKAVLHAMRTVHQLEVLALCVAATHMHVLVRLPASLKKPTALRRGLRETDPARYYMGIAKERSAKALAAAGLHAPGSIWARRGKIIPVHDRRHQLAIFQYILNHLHQHAAVWCFRQPDTLQITPAFT